MKRSPCIWDRLCYEHKCCSCVSVFIQPPLSQLSHILSQPHIHDKHVCPVIQSTHFPNNIIIKQFLLFTIIVKQFILLIIIKQFILFIIMFNATLAGGHLRPDYNSSRGGSRAGSRFDINEVGRHHQVVF